MKEFLEFAKGEFMAAKWYDKIWAIFLALCYVVVMIAMIYAVLFEPNITVRCILLFLWTALMLAVGALIGVLMD